MHTRIIYRYVHKLTSETHSIFLGHTHILIFTQFLWFLMYTTWLRHAQQKINCLRQPIFQKQTRHLCMAQMVIASKTAQIWHPRIVLISIAHQERKTQLVWPPWYCQLDQKILHQPFRTNIVTTLKINRLPLSKFYCIVVHLICFSIIKPLFFWITYIHLTLLSSIEPTNC